MQNVIHVTLDPTTRAKTFVVSLRDVALVVVLSVVMIFGAYLRFAGMNWDDYSYLHPDERFLTLQVLGPLGGRLQPTDWTWKSSGTPGITTSAAEQLPLCTGRYPQVGSDPTTIGVGGYFDTMCSTWNPNNVGVGGYVYGTLPLFIAKVVNDAWADMSPNLPEALKYNGVHLAWRVSSAFWDTGTILLVFLMAWRLMGKWPGVLAAALYCLAVLPIQKAHFGTVNATTSFFTALALYAAISVQKQGKLWDYVLFGVAFAAALAGRINMVPLAGVVVLSAILYTLPAFDEKLAWEHRRALLTRAVIGLVLAGFVSVICFRIFNPYAFMGPSFFGVSLNPRWLQDVQEGSFNVSGGSDGPPNWQWLGRANYIFPLLHITVWGLGIAFGVTMLLSWLSAGWGLLRFRAGALQVAIPFIWILVYFGWLGGIWVTTMRYYLPLYASFAVLTAWGLTTLFMNVRKHVALYNMGQWRVWAAGGVIAFVVGFTLLWALMFTNIYRVMLTRVQGAHWLWENVPADFAMEVRNRETNSPIANVPLINIAIPNRIYAPEGAPITEVASEIDVGGGYVDYFTATANGVITHVYAPRLGDPANSNTPKTVRVTLSDPADTINTVSGTLTSDFLRTTHPLGTEYHIPLDQPFYVEQGKQYTFAVEVIGGRLYIGGSVVATEGTWDDRLTTVNTCTLPNNLSITANGALPSGLVSQNQCNGRGLTYTTAHINMDLYMSMEDGPAKRDIILRTLDEADYLAITSNRFYDTQSRNPMRWPFSTHYYEALFAGELGFELVAQFDETFEFGPFRVSDQYLPNYSGPRWLNEFEADEAFHVYDHPAVFVFRKSANYNPAAVRRVLDAALGTPQQALTVGQCPENLGEFYCSTDLVGQVVRTSLDADASPTLLQQPRDVRAINEAGGTWSELFPRDSIVNAPLIFGGVDYGGMRTTLLWWWTIIVFGWVAFPLLFVAFPFLSDRGYGLAKISGLLLVSWLSWFLTSARLPLWSQTGLAICLVALFGISLAVSWRWRADLLAHIRQYRWRLLSIELITLIAFLAFVGVRLTNPDLWHNAMGGEKPMDFAYFNATLRTTIFPAFDPWHAGGYINYYYYGFVLVGAPTLLLGVVPSVAYNLVIPTLFALTGIGAFSVAFNAAAAWRARQQVPANPWVAGVAAFVLAVVLGNLGTIAVFVEGLAQTGGYNRPHYIEEDLIQTYQDANNGALPADEMLTQFRMQAQTESRSVSLSILWRGVRRLNDGRILDLGTNRWYWAPTRIIAEESATNPKGRDNAIHEMPFFTFLYADLHAHMIAMPLIFIVLAFLLNELLKDGARPALSACLSIGLGALTVGLLRATNTWDWLTFMILSFGGLGFVWWTRWKFRSETLIALALAALALGYMLTRQHTGIPDMASTLARYGALGVAGLFVLAWALWAPLSRAALTEALLVFGGFFAVQWFVALPFTNYFATAFSSAEVWEGPITSLGAYLTIHGLFLFLILSLLIWESVRWMSAVPMSALRGRFYPVMVALGAAGVGLVVVLSVGLVGYPVVWVGLPLLAWTSLLFFRPQQSAVMRFLLALVGLGLGLTLGVEFVVLSGDIGRQNTLFKFYIQVWLLFSVVGGVALATLVQATDRWSDWVRVPWFLVVGVMVAAAALYPVMATRGRAADRFNTQIPVSLDGMSYMQYVFTYGEEVRPGIASMIPFDGDYPAIRWMQDNIQGTPTIMEGMSSSEYKWGNRFAIYTGLPSVQGWRHHQSQQRSLPPMTDLVNLRNANVNAFYLTNDITAAWRILRHYSVRYVVVGELERARYISQPTDLQQFNGIAKFDQMVLMGLLTPVYQDGNTTIYQVNVDAILPELLTARG
jgi:YYY domain-containing protein